MKIASINFYVGNDRPLKDLELIKSLDITSIGFQEAWRHIGMIKEELDTHRVFSGKPVRAANEVAIALKRENINFLDAWGREVSDLAPGEETRIFKSRWITTVKFMHNGQKYAHINYHGNAAVQDRKTGNLLKRAERVKEWIEASVTIEKRIKRLQKLGYKVFVTGDWNYRRFRVRGFDLDYFSPQRIFKRCNLKWVEHGLDYVAYPKSMYMKKETVIPVNRTGGDHPWIIIDVV